MKLRFSGGGMLVLATLFLFIPYSVQGKIMFNEIFPNPVGSDKGREFIEIYNEDDNSISLNEWFIKKTSPKGSVKKYKFKEGDRIESKKYFTLMTSGLNNNGATVELFNNQGKKIDTRLYKNVIEGKSYNRDEKNSKKQWYWTIPSKNIKNSLNPADKKYPPILITEILPNPNKDDAIEEEFIELYNPNKEDVNLQSWQLRDASKTGKYIFKKETIIKAGKYLTIYQKDFKFALNNSGGETVKLLDPNDKEDKGEYKFKINYTNTLKGKSYNYNQDKKEWFWSQYLTPSEKNKFNTPPTFKINYPQKIYLGEEGEFKVIDLQDKDEDRLTVYWDFGNHRKKEGSTIKHQYNQTGKFLIRVTATDGLDPISISKYIQINIRPLPKLILVKLLPNPEGADTGNEEIGLKNIGDKPVDLQNYKIASGSTMSKITKHLLKESIILKAGETVTIKNNKCKFVLPNTKGVAEVLMPDNRVVDKVEYNNNGRSILPGQKYYLTENNHWQWTKPFPGNHLPTFQVKLSKKIYKNIYADFQVRHLVDSEGDRVRVVWDFGDGHKSYLKRTKHKYKKTGKYTVTLTVKDGKEEAVKQFKIKVKKYPKYKLQIVGLLPNPDGRDKGREFIILKNNSKKKINLLKYKIATGRNKKRLTGHPFYKKFILKAGEVKKLYNGSISKFSLLNKEGVVQLLYPNGKVADQLKYRKNKIIPNEQYILGAQQQWVWQGGIQSSSSNKDNSQTQVLGVRNDKQYIDITLNNQNKRCETVKQIKITNWQAENNRNKFKKRFLYSILL
jgi:PKD repeat protein